MIVFQPQAERRAVQFSRQYRRFEKRCSAQRHNAFGPCPAIFHAAEIRQHQSAGDRQTDHRQLHAENPAGRGPGGDDRHRTVRLRQRQRQRFFRKKLFTAAEPAVMQHHTIRRNFTVESGSFHRPVILAERLRRQQRTGGKIAPLNMRPAQFCRIAVEHPQSGRNTGGGAGRAAELHSSSQFPDPDDLAGGDFQLQF